MRAVFLDYSTLNPADLDLTRLHQGFTELVLHDMTGPDDVFARMAGFDVVIVNKVRLTAAHFSDPQLKLVLVAATGTDNIDKTAATAAGVVVCNVTAYGTATVAQHTLMLMLLLATQASRYQADVASGRWSRSPMFCLMDYPIVELSGRTLGLIGYGELGRQVGALGEAFGMQVLVMGRAGVDYADGTQRVDFETLLARSDVVSLHCLLTPETAHLMNADAFANMKSGAFLVNTARGGLVDEAALIHALESGHLGGAGLDVVSMEPPLADLPILACTHPNLIITPHSAWASREARQRIVEIMRENLDAFIEGAPINRVA